METATGGIADVCRILSRDEDSVKCPILSVRCDGNLWSVPMRLGGQMR